MKEMIHRLFSMIMAVLLLASTTSWTVGKHYCMGRVMDVSFFSKAEDCGMELHQLADTLTYNWENAHCCDDETVYIAGQNDLKVSLDKLTFEQYRFIASWVYHYIDLFEGLQDHVVPFKYYPPPILVKEITLWDQVFLI
jgi:hypothetical protein